MKFSDRIGATQIKAVIQKDSISESLKNTLWNIYDTTFLSNLKDNHYTRDSYLDDRKYLNYLWHSYFKEPVDSIPQHTSNVITKIRSRFLYEAPWYDVYNFIEFHAECLENEKKTQYINSCNKLLIQEFSGYRFVNDTIAPIISDSEINSIQNAISNSEKNELSGVKIHLVNSIAKLSDKTNPDYANSIKESISAVESLCKSISGGKGDDLTKALQKIRDSLGMHAAFSGALIKLYAYSSDEGGVRHGLLDESNLDQEDAIFMLVTCSAFINYMIVKNEKADKLIEAKK